MSWANDLQPLGEGSSGAFKATEEGLLLPDRSEVTRPIGAVSESML